MTELSSKTQPGGQVGDTFLNEEIIKVHPNGQYGWGEKIEWDVQVVTQLPASPRKKTHYQVMQSDGRLISVISKADGTLEHERQKIHFPLAGQYLLDPNELNAWGAIGPYDNIVSQDLGNVGDLTPSRLAGGLVYPFDVKLTRMYAWHQNSNVAVEPWGWVLFRQEKFVDTTNESSVYILDEAGSGNLRDYGNTTTQLTDITLDHTIPAGETLVLGVVAPTAVATNYYARIMSGFLTFEVINE